MRKAFYLEIVFVFVFFILPGVSLGARIKDVAAIAGVRDNPLIGYGLVVGLAGTGDDIKNGFTKDTLANLLSRQGLSMKDKTLKAENTAAVMVTATLPPFAKVGSKIDVLVSSIGNAKSLQGGTLLMTPLRGTDGEIYAIAQGPVTLGGFTTGQMGGGTIKNHPSVGRIPNGALVEKQVDYSLGHTLEINLFQPDFTTATRLMEAIKNVLGNGEVKAKDATTVVVNLPPQADILEVISKLENIDVPVDAQAIVVLNEKTGTVVMGEKVRVSTVAVAHGNLSIQIKEEIKVSQPLPFAPSPPKEGVVRQDKEGSVIVAPGGQTVITKERQVTAAEEKRQLMLVPQGVTIQDVVKALNAIGVTPRDLITILQAIKAAGALHGELKII